MFEANRTVQYRVNPETRYVITRIHCQTTPTGGATHGVEKIATVDCQVRAELIAQELSRLEFGSTYASACPGPVPDIPSPIN